MFSGSSGHAISYSGSGVGGSVQDCDGYDFSKNENAARWRGLFIPSLRKVLEQVNPRVTAKEDALFYVEKLCLRLLSMLCAKPLPHSVQDVEEKVNKSFPTPIDQWALNEAKEVINSKKRKSVLPTERVHTLLQKDVLQYKIDSSVSAFLVAVLEYISADILKMAGDYVCKISHCEITKEDIEVVMNADRVLMDMLNQSDIKTNVLPSPLSLPVQRASATYEETVKELIHDEKQYQRELHMIIRVFREELVKIVRDPKELDPIFSNIMDIYEVTVTLLGSLEDVIEMSQEQNAPCVGSCFEELAEAEEFDVYKKYAHDVTSQASRDALTNLLAKPGALSLMSAGHGFRDAVKYYLPKLLLVPICHAFVYFDYIKHLMDLSSSQDDIESFEQVQGLLHPLHCDLEKVMATLTKERNVPVSGRARRQMAIERTRELQSKVEHWDDKDVGQNCNEFIREDSLSKLGSGKRIWSERKVFLFDGLMVLCKPNTKKQTPSANTTAYDYRLKEKYFMRRVEINDRVDTDELKNSFELTTRVQPPIVLTAKNMQHKHDWMADLIMVNTKSMLDRILDSILQDIEKKHPLRMPSAELYKFAIPDSNENIVLEERESAGVPMIKGATLCKLIERLTYHIYADPTFVRTFLTTYRYFCSPQNLLKLLIERFDIPDPSLVYQEQHGLVGSGCVEKDSTSGVCDTDKMHKNSQREDWKRYRKEFVQPVQFRVLNVLRHWVDHHFYDFEKDPTLLEELLHFLENVNGKSMRKWVDSVLKIVQRKNEQEKSNKKIVFAYGIEPPPIEYHLNVPDEEITLLTLHPLELARQLTLLEFEMYKNVKPSELVGSPWTKKGKEIKSPNLLKIMKHTTNVTRWIEKSITEAENYEERLAIMQRAIEVMMVMLELNNFNGILSIVAAMGTASVYRLRWTFQGLPERYKKFLDECRELSDDHLKKYQERLRSINPPCVPFFGRYLTNILHLEEGNPDFLPNTELINFSKRRKVSEIIGEIQQYQNQPYCLNEEATIRLFFEQLDPFNGLSDKEMSDYLYNESMRIEPRGCKAVPKFPRKWPHISLKSPGIKPRRQNNSKVSNNAQPAPTNVEHVVAIAGEQSPVHHPNAFAVFAPVLIPERNGSNTWNGTPVHKVDNGELAAVPHLPKKPGAHVWTTSTAPPDVFSPALPEHNAGLGIAPPPPPAPLQAANLNSSWNNMPEERQQQLSNNPFAMTDVDTLPTSPLHKGVISPRHEVHSVANAAVPTGNRSPFHSRVSNATAQYSPTHSIASTVTLTSALGSGGAGMGDVSPQLGGFYYNSGQPAVPISPHVNVPTATNLEYRAVPPPLPPRRKERTESCADMAQKSQAPDAPTLPPRDGELSPPPIPPRLNHSFGGNFARHSQPKEFVGKNSLLLPNTSSIMIRRNSAIEKRAAAAAQQQKPHHQQQHPAQAMPQATTLVTVSQSPSIGSTADEQPPQSISPALSSSTTTSPMTPMTPMSPHIPTSVVDTNTSTSSIFQQQHQTRLKPQQQLPHMQHQHNNPPGPMLYQASAAGYQSHHHHHHHHPHPHPHHHHQQQHHAHHPHHSNTRSSPQEFFSIATSHEGTPKLPPKPSLSANFYNNPEKGTMFLYPSTNQE